MATTNTNYSKNALESGLQAQKCPEVNGDWFLHGTVTVQALGLTEDNMGKVYLGDITLSCEDREYKLNTSATVRKLDDIGVMLTIDFDFGPTEKQRSLFKDCNFDLKIEDLKSQNLIVTIGMRKRCKDITELRFISGSVTTNSEKLDTYSVEINYEE